MTEKEKAELEAHFAQCVADSGKNLSELNTLATSVQKINAFNPDDYAKQSFSLTGVSASATVASLAVSGVSLSLTGGSVRIRGLFATAEGTSVAGAVKSDSYAANVGKVEALKHSLAVVVSPITLVVKLFKALSREEDGAGERRAALRVDQ